MATKKDIFEKHVPAYRHASKREKKQLLNSICGVTGMHRKAVIRRFAQLMRKPTHVTPRKQGRPVYYTPDVTRALRQVWEIASCVCGELLYPVIDEYVTILQRDRMWPHSVDTTTKLLEMSESTVRDRVSLFMAGRKPSRGMSATKPGHLKEIIPIFTGPWEDKPPGYGQLDTVVHCGSSLKGDMVFTVNWTDVATLWGGRRAQWNKGQRATQESLSSIRARLPFPMLGAHPDTGSEFINWHLKGWCDEMDIELTRSRPNHKNDNAYVEQKNGHVVRRFLGYQRLDCRAVVPVMNELYAVLDRYLNHFVASRKCLEKVRIGSKYKKKYDKGMTPYQRVMAYPAVDEAIKTALRREHEQLNPLLLKQHIAMLQTRIERIQKDYERTT